MAIQQNNGSPMGFGQPQRAIARPSSGMGQPGPAKPMSPPDHGQMSFGPTPKPTAGLGGIPMAYDSNFAKKQQEFPADAAYKRIQKAIINPGQMMPQPLPPPPPMPPMMGMGGPPMMGGMPPAAPSMQMGPQGPPMPPMPPQGGAPQPNLQEAMMWMQQQLGGGPR